MQQTFHHIASIQLLHEYFKDKYFRTIQFSVTDTNQALIRNLGILIKPFLGGINILATEPELLSSTQNPIILYLYCTDSYYINYTQLPGFNPLDSVMYFNNLGGSPFLHEEEFVGEKSALPLCSEMIRIPNYREDKEYTFKDALGVSIGDDYIQKTPLSGEYRVTNYSEGLIRIYEEGEQVYAVYFNPKTVWKKPFGILEIYPDQLDDRTTSGETQNYKIKFESRSTIWKYFLVDPVYQRYPNLGIISHDGHNVFGPPKEMDVADKKAIVFESLEEFPLREYTDVHFKLIHKKDGVDEDIIKALPRASPDQLFRSDGVSMYSHIFI